MGAVAFSDGALATPGVVKGFAAGMGLPAGSSTCASVSIGIAALDAAALGGAAFVGKGLAPTGLSEDLDFSTEFARPFAGAALTEAVFAAAGLAEAALAGDGFAEALAAAGFGEAALPTALPVAADPRAGDFDPAGFFPVAACAGAADAFM